MPGTLYIHTMPQLTDLSGLERLCNGDQQRVKEFVQSYLNVAPELMNVLVTLVKVGDGERLASATHGLLPQVEYIGAGQLLTLLTTIETTSRAEGTAACAPQVDKAVALNEQVMAELRKRTGQDN